MNEKTKLLYAVGIGLIASDLIPTPADSVYFWLQQRNKQLLNENKISPRQYWTREALSYYGLNPIYWSFLVGISVVAGKDYYQKRNIFLLLLAGGAVLGVLNSNIKKDEQNGFTIKKAE